MIDDEYTTDRRLLLEAQRHVARKVLDDHEPELIIGRHANPRLRCTCGQFLSHWGFAEHAIDLLVETPISNQIRRAQ